MEWLISLIVAIVFIVTVVFAFIAICKLCDTYCKKFGFHDAGEFLFAIVLCVLLIFCFTYIAKMIIFYKPPTNAANTLKVESE